MSAIDVLHSFSESREADHILIRDGITYGVVRGVLDENERLRGLLLRVRNGPIPHAMRYDIDAALDAAEKLEMPR